MPTDNASGLVEPDIVINGRALTFAECMSVRVAVSSMRISLADAAFRAGLGPSLADNYDRHLARVEQTMLAPLAIVCVHCGSRSYRGGPCPSCNHPTPGLR